jgi:hypothetical protein
MTIFGLPGKEIDLMKTWIDSHEDWLLVMDNFDTISVPVERFIPSVEMAK